MSNKTINIFHLHIFNIWKKIFSSDIWSSTQVYNYNLSKSAILREDDDQEEQAARSIEWVGLLNLNFNVRSNECDEWVNHQWDYLFTILSFLNAYIWAFYLTMCYLCWNHKIMINMTLEAFEYSRIILIVNKIIHNWYEITRYFHEYDKRFFGVILLFL